ncbi:hypothetical protein OMAG_002354 [Candidatus Omnitrophus magneticus]|uniref:AsmA-like C-terminal domain-containing protein n=1 Tax=Candidatus Omnitrophus magneticus TaxID=1609969 RepID=A0A0F0CKL4_9BACT|nr:hypothetical protein OMAG_002354 [Candidatus Omnitrophus magneticus]
MVTKIFNIKGIVIVTSLLAVLHFGVGFFVSPILAPMVIEQINKVTASAVSLEKINIWPLTLSCQFKNLKVFDPKNTDERIIWIKDASLQVSMLGLLAKRLVVSELNVRGLDINLKGESDGSFNISKIVKPSTTEKEEKKWPAIKDIFEKFKAKKDLFGKVYEALKNRASKASKDSKLAKKESAKKISKEVNVLPKGKRVNFKRGDGAYLLEIKTINVSDGYIHIEEKSNSVDIEKAAIGISDLVVGSSNDVELKHFYISGNVIKEREPKGNFLAKYKYSETKLQEVTEIRVEAEKLDLTSVKFIYADSLPVEIEKGTLTLKSNTLITNEELNSKNDILLEDKHISPKGGVKLGMDIAPLPVICAGLNSVEPLKLNFSITGTVENPKFDGFINSLKEIIKPVLANTVETAKQSAVRAISKFLKKEGE